MMADPKIEVDGLTCLAAIGFLVLVLAMVLSSIERIVKAIAGVGS